MNKLRVQTFYVIIATKKNVIALHQKGKQQSKFSLFKLNIDLPLCYDYDFMKLAI